MPAKRSRTPSAGRSAARAGSGKTTTKGRAPASGMAQRRAGRRAAENRTSDERWLAILDAASRVFRLLGYQAATLEDVAKEVGINRATLYYYVADKAELLIAILDEPVHKMTRDLREIVECDADAPTKLRLAIERHMQALDENYPELFVFLAENMHLLTIGRDRDIQKNAREYGTLFTSIVADGIASREFREDLDPRVVMLGIVGMMNWSHRWYDPTGRFPMHTIAQQFAALALDGLSSRPRRDGRETS